MPEPPTKTSATIRAVDLGWSPLFPGRQTILLGTPVCSVPFVTNTVERQNLTPPRITKGGQPPTRITLRAAQPQTTTKTVTPMLVEITSNRWWLSSLSSINLSWSQWVSCQRRKERRASPSSSGSFDSDWSSGSNYNSKQQSKASSDLSICPFKYGNISSSCKNEWIRAHYISPTE